MAKSISSKNDVPGWQSCYYCPMQTFKTSADFCKHLRDCHCSQEGGSFVCRYGYNGVCPSLPLDGVSDRDYASHVNKHHVNQVSKDVEQWSVFLAAQNLPAVLNDPSRGKQLNLFTKKWGDSFVEKTTISPSPYLCEISWNQFNSYLARIGKRYKRHIHINQTNAERESQSTIFSSSMRAYNELNNASLKDIPQIFLQSNFELHNPTTFATIFLKSDDQKTEVSLEQLSTSRLLQERLSHHLDIVEVQIAKQVSLKSGAFFHAMTSQDTIMEQMEHAAKNVKDLRQRIKRIDVKMVKEYLKMLSMARTRNHYMCLLDKLKLMSTVHQTQPMIQLLLGTQDYVAALDLISTTQEIISQELNGIHCFRHLPLQLKEMERLIDKMLTTEFERYCTADLNRPLEIKATMNGEIDSRVLDEDKLISVISGLLRQRNFQFVDAFKEESIDTIKAVVKQMVIEIIASSSDNEICLTGAGEDSHTLTINEWIQLLGVATTTLNQLLNRINAVREVIIQTALSNAGHLNDMTNFKSTNTLENDFFLSEEDYQSVEGKLSDAMKSICNYCHERCANLVSSQSLEQHTANAEQIEKLQTIIDWFNEQCFKIGGIHCIPLKQALTAQCVRFSQQFHTERKTKLALILDSERWKQADVPAAFQLMIDRIGKGDFSTAQENGVSCNGSSSKVLYVEGEPYTLVGAALILVQIISEYCRCAIQIPVVSPQLSRHCVDLLRTFNSRCCQLVLGAGAIHVAGLKTITSTTLAMVSRALQLVLWTLKYVQKHFQRLDEHQTNSGYDSVEKDISSHIKEIEKKVLQIVTDLVHSQLNSWDARPPIPSQSFRTISRHFVKLHEAISTILPEPQIHSIYRTINKSFKDKLREQLIRNNIVNNGGPQHGVVISELTFYLETMRSLKALPTSELTDDMMSDIWTNGN